MTVILLAGGLGSRMYPLTRIVPKPMVPLAGKPILEHIIDYLNTRGFKEIVIAARYLGEQIVRYFSNHPHAKPVLLDSKDTADAVRLLGNYIRDHFIVAMGDVICNADYSEIYGYHLSANPAATIALKQVENPLPYGVVYLDENMDVALFVEKPVSLEAYLLSLAYYRRRSTSAYENLVNAGIYVFNPYVLEVLERNPGLMDFGRHVFPYLVENGFKVKGYVLSHRVYWSDIGRIDTYKSVMWDLLDGKIAGIKPPATEVSPGVYIHPSSDVRGEIRPPVYIGREVRVKEGAVVGPYAVLEDGVVVEEGSRMVESIVWHGTIVGRDSVIYDSIVMNNVKISRETRVYSSIIGTRRIVSGELRNSIMEPVEVVSPYAQSA